MTAAVPSNYEILALAWQRLDGDTGLKSLLGGDGHVWNHVPQDLALPAVRVRWGNVSEWDTKTSNGLDGTLTVDIWTSSYGDKLMLRIADRIEAIMHGQPLTGMTTGQSLLLRHTRPLMTTVEPDGLTHHGVMQYHHIATN